MTLLTTILALWTSHCQVGRAIPYFHCPGTPNRTGVSWDRTAGQALAMNCTCDRTAGQALARRALRFQVGIRRISNRLLNLSASRIVLPQDPSTERPERTSAAGPGADRAMHEQLLRRGGPSIACHGVPCRAQHVLAHNGRLWRAHHVPLLHHGMPWRAIPQRDTLWFSNRVLAYVP